MVAAVLLATLPAVFAYSYNLYYIGDIYLCNDYGSKNGGYEGGWYHWDGDNKAEMWTEFSIPGGWYIKRGATSWEGGSYTWYKSCNNAPVPEGFPKTTHTNWDVFPAPGDLYMHFAMPIGEGNRYMNWRVWEADGMWGTDQDRSGSFWFGGMSPGYWYWYGNSIGEAAVDSQIQVYYIGGF